MRGYQTREMTPEAFDALMSQANAKQWEELKTKGGFTPESFQSLAVSSCLILGGANLLGSILTLVGAARMLALRSYSLGILGSVLAAVPCLSLSACILVGIGIGVWSLVVLLNNDIRAAFRAAAG
jgi:hypothetical protein